MPLTRRATLAGCLAVVAVAGGTWPLAWGRPRVTVALVYAAGGVGEVVYTLTRRDRSGS
jgi:hypothetical protein